MRSAVSCGQLSTEMRANAVDLLKQLEDQEDQVRIRQFALVHPGPPWSYLHLVRLTGVLAFRLKS